MDPETARQIELVASVLRDGPPVKVAMLFGSAARGTLHDESDIDVGIIPVDSALPLRAELDLQARVAHACGRAVDLVRLDRASTLLKWQAVRDGHVIPPTSHADFVRFSRDAALEYADFAPALKQAESLFRQRLRKFPASVGVARGLA